MSTKVCSLPSRLVFLNDRPELLSVQKREFRNPFTPNSPPARSGRGELNFSEWVALSNLAA